MHRTVKNLSIAITLASLGALSVVGNAQAMRWLTNRESTNVVDCRTWTPSCRKNYPVEWVLVCATHLRVLWKNGLSNSGDLPRPTESFK